MAVLDEDDYDRRPQRRKFEEPVHVKVRKTASRYCRIGKAALAKPKRVHVLIVQ